MGGVPGGGHWRKGGSGQAPLISVVAVLCLALAVAAGPAVAKKITGSKRSERIVGTKKSDKISGKGGNDLVKGKGGNDRLNGGRGSDKVVGGKGNDKVVGGPKGDTVIGGPRVDRMKGKGGNDLLNAADGRRDSVIDGGAGTNKCIVDTWNSTSSGTAGRFRPARRAGRLRGAAVAVVAVPASTRDCGCSPST